MIAKYLSTYCALLDQFYSKSNSVRWIFWNFYGPIFQINQLGNFKLLWNCLFLLLLELESQGNIPKFSFKGTMEEVFQYFHFCYIRKLLEERGNFLAKSLSVPEMRYFNETSKAESLIRFFSALTSTFFLKYSRQSFWNWTVEFSKKSLP